MSNLRISCPRCHANLHVNRHQEQSGHLGCTHCGQLIRLAPSHQSSMPTMSTPMVAPAFQQGAYWNQSPQTRKQSNNALWAVAIASLGLFLTVLTLCVTLLLWQQQQKNQPANQVARQEGNGFIERQPEAAPLPPVVEEQPEVAAEEPVRETPPPGVKPVDEDPLGRNRNEVAQNAPPTPRAIAPEQPQPPPRRPQPFAANRPTAPPPPELEPLEGPPVERPQPSLKID